MQTNKLEKSKLKSSQAAASSLEIAVESDFEVKSYFRNKYVDILTIDILEVYVAPRTEILR